MDKNERIFVFQIIPKAPEEKGGIVKIKANSYSEAQDEVDRKFVNKRVKAVYQGIDAGAKNGVGR